MTKQKMVTKVFNSLYPLMFKDYLNSGGSTYSHEGKRTEGFAVGGYADNNEVSYVEFGDLELNDLYWFKHYVQKVVEKYSDKLAKSRYFIGTWHDAENDMLVIDLVRVFEKEFQAVEIAQHRNQSHIFDLGSQNLIKVKNHV